MPTWITAILLALTLLFTFEFTEFLLENNSQNEIPQLAHSFTNQIDCDSLFSGNKNYASEAALWKFDETPILEVLEASKDRCKALKSLFGFYEKPLSKEEEDFPLAYGMLVHKDIVQVYFLLSTIYQPQNQFCIAVDGNSGEEYFNSVLLLADCFPNIHVFRSKPISWCGFSILEAVMDCVTYLSDLKSHWKYFQYLSGVDAALKTNIEMVKIFKALNGSINAEIAPYDRNRLNEKWYRDSPLPLFKTSLSALFPREAIDFMAHSQIVKEQINFLNETDCADESLWVTVAGNPRHLSFPGGFDAGEFLHRHFPAYRPLKVPENSYFPVESYYISRFQQWINRAPSKCKGNFYRLSCIFGVHDLPLLVRRYELVAHKLYLDYQPAAFLCLVKEIRRRSLFPLKNFTASDYRNLPGAPIRTTLTPLT